MEEDCEPETEGVINIPKVMKLSSISLIEKKLRLKGHKKKSISTTTLPTLSLYDDNFDDNDKLNTSIIYDRNKISLKNEDNNSTKSKSPVKDDKIKRVTFSSVEIIRVKNFKRYNKLNTAKKNEEEVDDEYNTCILF